MKKAANLSKQEIDLRKKCNEYASQQVEIQKKQLEQLGIFTDYGKFYITKDKHYEAEQIRIFAETDIFGAELIGLKYYHPYQQEIVSKIIDGGELIAEQEGTGILHCAPAFGAEDFSLAQREKLTITCPLDEKGYFTQEIKIPELIGKHYQEVSK
ncbi:11997_t:CDS:2 [Entrophospora sp. SA101]|nr:14597_t:CDS:2 [Entrophospora sp. SA101]CAJ0906330.1 11997_t:CDS:2 [Entrophospora sp. SA101]CAJ0917005.1 171_t:CDS:2 [Entrophospora sp. SA101]